jgi:hypothetical protein
VPIDRKAIAEKAVSLIGCGYVIGATGWICTQARLEAQARQYPQYAAKTLRYGPRWLGCKCYDCAQLTRVAARAGGVELPGGATSQWRSGLYSERDTIGMIPPHEAGIQVFREGSPGVMEHTGVYLGDGYTVEARGVQHGVVRRALTDGSWTHWGRFSGVTRESWDTSGAQRNTIRRGDRGPEVSEAQGLLERAGYPLPLYGCDGSFGAETERAARAFQVARGLAADGIIGPASWAALLAAAPDPGDDGDGEGRYDVRISGVDEAVMREILARYPGAEAAMRG